MIKSHSLKKLSAMLLASLTLSTAALAQQYPEIATVDQTHETVLDNGLKVLVREDHRSPVVTTMIWYKVGSVDEPRGLGGISHMLEHMMFKGTDTLGPNEHSTIVANLGGRDNAFTSTDYTAYFESLPAWELETALKLEADRMENLELRAEDFTPERLVVAEERRQRTDSNPQAKLYEAFNATMFTTSAYRNPVIGWMPEIEGWSLEDLQNWYQQFYAPNNATVVIVGDVDPNKTIEMVNQYFGQIPSSNNIVRPANFEVAQTGEKRIDLALPANLPVLFMGYKTPSINETEDEMEAATLLLTSLTLDGTRSSRLEKALVRDQQIALQAGNYYNYGARYTTPFTFIGVPAEGVSLETLENAFKQELHKLQTEPVTQAEVDRIIGLYEASNIYAQDSVYAQAMLLGQAETTGEGWQNAEKRVELLKQVTPEMIQAVAQKYFQDDLATVATLHPSNRADGNNPHNDEAIDNTLLIEGEAVTTEEAPLLEGNNEPALIEFTATESAISPTESSDKSSDERDSNQSKIRKETATSKSDLSNVEASNTEKSNAKKLNTEVILDTKGADHE
ncbi:pitrilysin family protein [Ignatzschineria larvae DSM 13226]|uniref:Pitrilysin family protein n=1 Tax=Ignatzschineria larvae DSM 13226 TaxID=1111732 RepID=A0ABZ3C2E3_9GAMM|nr:pitrilysin family protein [Ignatzschineria larvae]